MNKTGCRQYQKTRLDYNSKLFKTAKKLYLSSKNARKRLCQSCMPILILKSSYLKKIIKKTQELNYQRLQIILANYFQIRFIYKMSRQRCSMLQSIIVQITTHDTLHTCFIRTDNHLSREPCGKLKNSMKIKKRNQVLISRPWTYSLKLLVIKQKNQQN